MAAVYRTRLKACPVCVFVEWLRELYMSQTCAFANNCAHGSALSAYTAEQHVKIQRCILLASCTCQMQATPLMHKCLWTGFLNRAATGIRCQGFWVIEYEKHQEFHSYHALQCIYHFTYIVISGKSACVCPWSSVWYHSGPSQLYIHTIPFILCCDFTWHPDLLMTGTVIFTLSTLVSVGLVCTFKIFVCWLYRFVKEEPCNIRPSILHKQWNVTILFQLWMEQTWGTSMLIWICLTCCGVSWHPKEPQNDGP